MLAIPVIVIISVFVLSLTWLALVVAKHKKILNYIRQVVDKSEEINIDNVYSALSQMAGESSSTYIVGRTNRRTSLGGDMIRLPQNLKNFPWAGKLVHIHAGTQTDMVISDKNGESTQLGGRIYENIPVPSIANDTGKDYVQYSPYKWLDQSKALASAISRLTLRHGEKLLSYLVTPGKDDYNFEPAYQVRIGEGVSWVQKPVSPSCEVCGESMRFILQCPGSLLNNQETAQAILYLFGCSDHPEQTECVTQYL